MEDKNKTRGQKSDERKQNKGRVGKEQPPSESNKTLYKEEDGGLTKEDLPDATNESTGKMGSGQRQDSN